MSVERFSRQVILRKSIHCLTVVVGLVALVPTASLAFAASSSADCADATELVLDTEHLGYSSPGEPAQAFRLEIPAAGLVHLELVTEGASETLAALALFPEVCGGSGAAVLLEHTPTHLVLAVPRPETLFFRTRADEVGRTSGPYTLSPRYVAARVVEANFTPSPGSSSAGDGIDVTYFYAAHPQIKSEPIEVDPDPGLTTTLPLPGKLASTGSLAAGRATAPGLLVTLVTLRLAGSAGLEHVVVYP
ncbi:MAG: hypothetical protein AAF657_23925 [Acidobacteriota bacterium]